MVDRASADQVKQSIITLVFADSPLRCKSKYFGRNQDNVSE